jgi:CheY-like chemotaxis protein
LPIYRDADWDNSLNDDSISPENLKRQPERTTSVKESEESILIVDDNVVALNLLQILLELEGYTVYSATTAAAGEELFAAHRPSIVLLDVGLPDLNGCDLAERIRALPSGGSALLVAVTGWATEQDTQKSLDAGFDAHLAKPVSVDDLIALFKQHRAEK